LSDIVKDWELYLSGKKYNNSINIINGYNYYDLVDALIDFYNGNQWRNMENNTMRKPVFNIVQKAIRYFVASLTSANTRVNLETLEYAENVHSKEIDAAEFANSEISNLLEKFKFDNRLRDALFKSGIMGDVAAHMYFNVNKKPYGGAFGEVKGEIEFELVNGTNVFFGNANNPNVEIQPYIIISGRDMVQNLKDEAKQYQQQQSEIDNIQSDSDYGYEAGESAEIEVNADGFGKAQYIIIYRRDKKTGKIMASKCVESAYIYQNIDTGLDHYPVAWLPWEKMESCYHGMSPCTQILETQIFINLMFAMIMLHQANTSFPKAVYNADVISEWTNEIATAIPVHGLGYDVNIAHVAGYLPVGNMSNQLVQVIDMAYNYTKDILGINDAALGNVNPENTSGKAIVATAKQASIPLENIRANEYEWVEDIVRILLDMMGTYYGLRPIVIDKDGQRVAQQFDFSVLKNLWLNIKVDVGETSIFSDIARKQTLDNLLGAGKIELLDYLERLDDSDIKDRQGLINTIKATMTNNNPNQNIGNTGNSDYEAMAQFFDTLPIEIQNQLNSLPPDQMEMQVRKMMSNNMQ
jgi:hypothetical protein